jgi:hypothetical protein
LQEVSWDGEYVQIVIGTYGPAANSRRGIDDWLFKVCMPLIRDGVELPLFRGVDDRGLERALAAGIDVRPPDHHWYAAELEKALEYGGDHPAILIIDSAKADRTWREVAVDAPAEEHADARRFTQHNPLTRRDGQRMLYTRLPPTDSRQGSEYELSYAYYIPGDATDALIGYIRCVPAPLPSTAERSYP